jgi:hypothetical protein
MKASGTTDVHKQITRSKQADTASALVITYARTENLFNGEPWPPDGSDYWAIVKRDRGHTIWRRIAAATSNSSRVTLAANGARRSSGGKQETQT